MSRNVGTFEQIFGAGKPDPMLQGSNGNLYGVSSFGVDGTTFGRDFDPAPFMSSERYQVLQYRLSQAGGRQHDHKTFDAKGRVIKPGRIELSQPLIGGSLPSFYVPMDQRRSSTPHRIPRLIRQRFTALVFGAGRWPTIKVAGDSDAEDFANALVESQKLPTIMIRARNKGGSCGTAVLSWRFWDGSPRVRIHNASEMIVHEWKDREALEVEHASEFKKILKEVYNPRKQKMERIAFWQRRDWTPNADVTFLDVRADSNDFAWVVDEENTYIHDDGEAHLVWIQNLPPDDEDNDPVDGVPDVDGLYENISAIDSLSTVLMVGADKNCDPTLILKMDPEHLRGTVSKGSDNALKVGSGGDAHYLELAGTSINACMALRDAEEQHVFDVAQCVVETSEDLGPDASGTSIMLKKAPMLSQGDVFRAQYGSGVLKLIGQQLRSARRLYPSKDAGGEWVYPEDAANDAGAPPQPVAYYLDLPQRTVETDVIGQDGKPTGEVEVEFVDRHPGTSDKLSLEWPPYFELSPADRKVEMDELQGANGGRPVLSQKSAVELFAKSRKRDAVEEQKRIDDESDRERDRQDGIFAGGAGGKIADSPPLSDEVDELVHSVNDFRARAGSGPMMKVDGTVDPDGFLPLAEFKAKVAARGQAAGTVEGQSAVQETGEAPTELSPNA